MTNSGVALTQIGPLDMAVVSALHAQCFGEGQWDERAVAEVFAMPGAFGFVALKQDVPAGFVFARVAADECEILSLGVCPALRRAGLGRSLLKAAHDHAAACGARAIYLDVAEDNEAARRFYATEGFAVIGRRQAYYQRGNGRSAAALVLGRRST